MTKVFSRTAVAAALLTLTACGGPEAAPAPSSSAPDTRFYDQYVALGDSYTAAPLVGSNSLDDPCLRSSIDYPRLLARYLGASLLDRSCTGATIPDLVRGQVVRGDKLPAQVDAITTGTDLVTVGVGGNPVAAQAWFQACPALREQDPEASPCRDHFLDEGDGADPLAGLVRKEQKQLVTTLRIIHERAPQARVMVVGYPAIFPDEGDCPRRLALATGDIDYARQTLLHLNRVLEQAAEQGNAEYVDVYAATRGHDICSREPWIQGSKDKLGVALAYHPRAEEQRAVADLLLRRLR